MFGADMTSASSSPRSVLTIAGSDSGGGAGIQADLKTFAAHGVHGLSAIAALTAQNTRGVTGVHVPPAAFLRQQLEVCFDDFDIPVVKLGMLANAELIDTVAAFLRERPGLQVVLDPVMVATSGARLLELEALTALRERLLPLATVITPNIPEAELLLGVAIPDAAAASAAVQRLLALGARGVLLKGGHLGGGDVVVDRLATRASHAEFGHPRLSLNGHGTGCTLASAVAANLVRGLSLEDACRAATDYVHGALQHAYRPGRSDVSVLDHLWNLRSAPR